MIRHLILILYGLYVHEHSSFSLHISVDLSGIPDHRLVAGQSTTSSSSGSLAGDPAFLIRGAQGTVRRHGDDVGKEDMEIHGTEVVLSKVGCSNYCSICQNVLGV